MVIWKYPLSNLKVRAGSSTASETVSMPKGATILSCHFQGSTITLWAGIDPDNIGTTEPRIFEVVPTGGRFAELTTSHLGTLQDKVGMVWHVFEQHYRDT